MLKHVKVQPGVWLYYKEAYVQHAIPGLFTSHLLTEQEEAYWDRELPAGESAGQFIKRAAEAHTAALKTAAKERQRQRRKRNATK